MSPNDQYRLWTFVFLFRLTKQSVNDHLREFNICISKKTPTSWAQHDTLQETIAFANKRKSLLVIPLENKLNDLKPLFSRKKRLTFQKRSKEMLTWTLKKLHHCTQRLNRAWRYLNVMLLITCSRNKRRKNCEEPRWRSKCPCLTFSNVMFRCQNLIRP